MAATKQQIINKMGAIMRLATKITLLKEADVFIEYYGHVHKFSVAIWFYGWKPEGTPGEKHGAYIFHETLSGGNDEMLAELEAMHKRLCDVFASSKNLDGATL